MQKVYGDRHANGSRGLASERERGRAATDERRAGRAPNKKQPSGVSVKISVTPGDVQIASIEVRRHTGGIYTIQISTPHDKHPGIVFGGGEFPGQGIMLHPVVFGSHLMATGVEFTPESNEEEEALYMGLFDVLDDWSRYSVTLIAIPASVLEEAQAVGSWEPQGPIDYLATS